MFPVERVPENEIDEAILRALPKAGVFAVGGRVRDEVLSQLGRPVAYPPNHQVVPDFLVTGMVLDDVINGLRSIGRAELVGSSFGVIKLTTPAWTVDVALPRRERSTGTHHRDFDIQIGPEIPIDEDLARRDFKVNMMARDLRSGAVIDPYGGREDLERSRLAALRDEAFIEDPLRVLRGAQFAARFNLVPTPATLDAMRAASDLIPTVAAERIAEELTKLLELSDRPSIGFELLREVSALHHILPELTEGWQIEQNEYHRHTVYYHSLACCDQAPPELGLRLAALLHDVGKPRTKDGPHFYRHEFVGEEMVRSALTRLRFSFDLIDRVCDLVAHHMFQADDSLTDAAIRRFIRRVRPERVDELFALRRADVVASGLPPRDAAQQARFEHRVYAEIAAQPPFGIRDLGIGGEDVIAVLRELGLAGDDFKGDSRVGKVLQWCLEQVLDDPRKNDRAILRGLVRHYLEAGG
jgi:tRNA nucleotidyltransferase (CCA-adding enzyme)